MDFPPTLRTLMEGHYGYVDGGYQGMKIHFSSCDRSSPISVFRKIVFKRSIKFKDRVPSKRSMAPQRPLKPPLRSLIEETWQDVKFLWNFDESSFCMLSFGSDGVPFLRRHLALNCTCWLRRDESPRLNVIQLTEHQYPH